MAVRLLDALLNEHLNYEAEQVHVLTALYGVACRNEATPVHISTAKCLELMKAATLVLDDFLDKASTRNGLPSIYAERGAEESVLLGEMLRSSALIELCQVTRGMPAEVVTKAVCLFEETYRTICLGQLEDAEMEKTPLTATTPTEGDYFQMIQHTSAVFIQLPLLLGGLLAGRSQPILHALGEYGLKVGLAYQVRDDVLDILASTTLTGKPHAGDIRNRKKRLPVLRLRDCCKAVERERLVGLFNGDGAMNEAAVEEVIAMMEKHGAVDSCKHTTATFCSEGLASIKGKVSEQELDQLAAIAGLLTDFTCLNEVRQEEAVSPPE